PAPDRAATTCSQIHRSQDKALLATYFIETITLTGTRMYILAVIEHASRRIRILGATAHPTAAWVTQAARNRAMDLQDAGCRVKYLIRDRDGKCPALFDAVLADAGITVVLSGVQVPRMNAVMQTVGAHLPARVARPYLDLEPATPAARATPVRGLLQHPPPAPGHRQRPTTHPAARTDHRPGPARPPQHPST